MNSSSRSHCSCCQSWDKGPWCAADLKGKRSLLPGIPWGTLVLVLLPHRQEIQQQVPITSTGKKRGQFHMARKVYLWAIHRFQTLQHQFQTPVCITGSTEQWRTKPLDFQNVHCTHYTPHCTRNCSSQSETTSKCFLQTSFVLRIYVWNIFHWVPSKILFLLSSLFSNWYVQRHK